MEDENKRFTDKTKTASIGTYCDTSYAILIRKHPFEKDIEVAVRVFTEIGPEDVYQVLGEVIGDIKLTSSEIFEKYERSKDKEIEPRPDRGIVEYKEYTKAYADCIENKLKESGELE